MSKTATDTPIQAEPKKKSKFLIYLIGLFLLIGLIVVGIKWIPAQIKNSRRVCKDSTIKEAMPYFTFETNQKLNPIAESIRQRPGYEKDPDCMYIVLMNSINNLSAEKSRDDLTKLEKAYDPKVGFSKVHGRQMKSINELRDLVVFVEKKDQEARNGFKTFGEPTR